MPPFHFTPGQARSAMPDAQGDNYGVVFRRGTLELGLYAPRGRDPQGPHARDEIYVVIAGRGWFRSGEDRYRFGPGDALVVPAGVPHRFEECSDDLSVWVIFCGP